jgi:hypothetical protein
MNPHYPVVSRRAGGRCEYCRAPESITNCEFEVDHVWPLARDGPDDLANLALACRACNLRKQDRIELLDEEAGHLERLFNPREDRWENHFQFDADSGIIIPLTAIGRVTVAILDLNHPRQVVARLLWLAHRLYP